MIVPYSGGGVADLGSPPDYVEVGDDGFLTLHGDARTTRIETLTCGQWGPTHHSPLSIKAMPSHPATILVDASEMEEGDSSKRIKVYGIGDGIHVKGYTDTNFPSPTVFGGDTTHEAVMSCIEFYVDWGGAWTQTVPFKVIVKITEGDVTGDFTVYLPSFKLFAGDWIFFFITDDGATYYASGPGECDFQHWAAGTSCDEVSLSSDVPSGDNVVCSFTETTQGIEGMSRAHPCVVTWTNHGLVSGDYVKIQDITQAEWLALNDTVYRIVKVDDNRFTIGFVNTSGFGAPYNPGVDPGTITKGFTGFFIGSKVRVVDDDKGEWTRVIEVVSPGSFKVAHLDYSYTVAKNVKGIKINCVRTPYGIHHIRRGMGRLCCLAEDIPSGVASTIPIGLADDPDTPIRVGLTIAGIEPNPTAQTVRARFQYSTTGPGSVVGSDEWGKMEYINVTPAATANEEVSVDLPDGFTIPASDLLNMTELQGQMCRMGDDPLDTYTGCIYLVAVVLGRLQKHFGTDVPV